MKKQILSNIGSNYALSLFGMALGFLLVPFLAHKLGKEVYGITVLAESTVAFFEILTISVRIALSRHAAFSLSQEKQQDFIEYLSTGRLLLFVSGALVLAAGCVLSYFFPVIFKVPAGFERQSQLLFLFITVGEVICVPNIVFWSALYAKQRFDLINFSSSFGLVMRALCLFLYYSLVPKDKAYLCVYGLIYLAMMYAQNTTVYVWYRKIFAGTRISIRYFRRQRVKEIISFSVHTAMGRLSTLLYENTSNILINLFWGPSFNAVFSVGLKLPNMMRRIFVEPGYTLTPTFTDLVARNEKQRIETLLMMYSKTLSTMTFPVVFSLIFLARAVIRAWVGPEFELAGKLLPLFCLPLFTGIPFSLTGSITNAYGKVKIPSFVSLGSATLNVILCYVFGQLFSWKLYGIAIAGFVSTGWTMSIFYPIYTCRITGISYRKYTAEAFLKPFLLSLCIMGGGFLLWRAMGLEVKIGPAMAAYAVLLVLINYITAFFLIFDPAQKKHLHEILRSVFGVLSRPFVKMEKSDVEL